MTYLFAHLPKTPKAHTIGGIAQAKIIAKTLVDARREFERLFPDRVVVTDGILGREG